MTAPETSIPPQSGEPAPRRRRFSVNALLDGFFFVFAGFAALWLATLVFGEGFTWRWSAVVYFLAFWALVAYLVLPRLHRILTTIYVPDYFIGRARTSDGLLGDPVNLAFTGGADDVHRAMLAAGWTRADDVTAASSWRIVTSTLSRRSYDEAPVSPLFLFGRQQDFAYQQEVAGNPAKRHHVRFWRCPDGWLLPGGHRVDWLAAGTFDKRVGLSLFTLQITHKIDADTDVERDHIVATLVDGADATVRVIRDFSTGYHSRNGGGDSIVTDGDLPVVEVGRPIDAPPEHPQRGRVHVVAKRSSFESPLALADRVEAPRAMARPITTVAGTALVLLRIVGGGAWIAALVASWSDLVAEAGLDPDDAAPALWVIVGIAAIALAVQLSVVLLVYRGSNGARILILALATAGILATAGGWWIQGEEITIRTTLVTLSLDILILLALSSRSARAYARRNDPALRQST